MSPSHSKKMKLAKVHGSNPGGPTIFMTRTLGRWESKIEMHVIALCWLVEER